MTPHQIDQFLDRPLIAHVTSLREDGSPHTVPVWYQYAEGRFYVFTPSNSVKVRNLRRDPRLTISIASEDEPYRYVVADGVAELSDEHALDRGGAIGSRYRGDGGPAYVENIDSKYGGVTIVTLEPTRVRAWASD
ncbi:MAG: PPOX class F420-dependent oxidoreductase [Chloroflexi bacterium]|nr:PPOX class F420-dependent oxidoreductase [Chloroflexota bacterium]